MNDTIRKAVELAEGWTIRNTEYGDLFGIGDSVAGIWGHFNDDPFKPPLDALAAQLVRQVDALDGGETIAFCSNNDIACVYSWNVSIGLDDTFDCEGPDRTMNTITAIVESGVLE